MAKKKLQSFSADDASDVFTPTVKTFVSAETALPSIAQNPASQSGTALTAAVPADSPAKESSEPNVQPQPQATPKTVKDGPSVSQVQSAQKPVETKEIPAEKIVKPEPVAPPKAAPLPVKASGSATLAKPAVKPESKPAVPKKTPASQPTPVDKAKPKQPETREKVKATSQTHIELVGFILGKEEYAIEINKVQDINRMVEITRVPKAPDFVEGVMNLRGKVLPVIHLRKRFNLPDKPFDRSSRIIVVEVAGSIMGFIVDAITEVLRVPSHIIEQAPDLVTGIDSEYIMGVGKLENRLLILIDLGKVLTKKTS